jgi:hypothetical protein
VYVILLLERFTYRPFGAAFEEWGLAAGGVRRLPQPRRHEVRVIAAPTRQGRPGGIRQSSPGQRRYICIYIYIYIYIYVYRIRQNCPGQRRHTYKKYILWLYSTHDFLPAHMAALLERSPPVNVMPPATQSTDQRARHLNQL